MATDPVCKMTVDEKQAVATAVSDGRTYYFCSAGCKRTFDMTSTVKYPDDARTGRAVGSLGPAPDVVDAGVIGSGTRGL